MESKMNVLLLSKLAFDWPGTATCGGGLFMAFGGKIFISSPVRSITEVVVGSSFGGVFALKKMLKFKYAD